MKDLKRKSGKTSFSCPMRPAKQQRKDVSPDRIAFKPRVGTENGVLFRPLPEGPIR
ncbi:MAG: hypothetical protein AVDCRST_MAG96-2915 [uncultured Segetibacter sp.]|uniref:Uncharacterized protein n=1 Tax=uncultured Segetibacter sp. TaxID=481133 RepID=A0A6J4TDW0_9BACT|nr:MAG: hypothetical protein AVDCRST_MAG96-2915 [uncultured Segetibacter sp.]